MQLTKKELRKTLLAERRGLDKSYRQERDIMIYNNLIDLPELAEADTVLTYVSTEIEVDTIYLIDTLLRSGFTVGVPKCEGKTMRFIEIDSLCDLETGAYGILEPKGDKVIDDFEGSVCITPALAFDEEGYRTGYGGGYYDRFLADYTGISVGICYEQFIRPVIKEEHDLNVNIIVTEKEIRYT